MTHADSGQTPASATPSSEMGATPSTGIIMARAAGIAGLIFLGTGVLFVVGRAFEPLTVLALSSFTAIVCVPLFFGAAIVHMLAWRKRTSATGVVVPYGVRVRRLSTSWLAIMAIAVLSVVAFTAAFAAALDVSNEGAWPFALMVVGPVLVLGLVGIAVVESIYERKTRAAAVTGA